MPFLSRVSKPLLRTGPHNRWHHAHTLFFFSVFSPKLYIRVYTEELFQIKPYVSVRGAHRAKFRRTLARTAHVTCISLVDRNLDQSRKHIIYIYIHIYIKERLKFENTDIGISTCNNRGNDHDPRYIFIRAHYHRSEIFLLRGSQDIPKGCPSPSESVAVAAMVILHLAVASAGGRAASTRRK